MDSHVASKTPVPLPANAYENYRGKWIALDAGGTSILASADSLSVLEDQLVAAGEDPQEVIFDRVEDEDVMLGGAELL